MTGMETAAGALGGAIAQGVGAKIAEASARIGSRVFDKAKVAFEVGFTPYLEMTYEKCRYYKTLLNPLEPCDLMDTYVNVSMERPSDNGSISDVDIINNFLDGHKYVVTGLAGCGKSMFMKFASLSAFGSSNRLPLFFELRRINDLTDIPNLIDLLYQECTPDRSTITKEQFKLAIHSGLFAVILDGFDEVEHLLRRQVSKGIDKFATEYPNCSVLISSRPDNDVFQSWVKFEVIEVEDFDHRQTIELINKSKYNSGVKNRFLKALDDRLFETHGSFLQSPLLTIIMLLTYEEFAEIPDKMHAFYARAFDTLFQKHDADKEQFVRKTRTGLSSEDFKLILSAFCAMSYIDEKFSFDRASFEKYIEAGINYAQKVNDKINAKKSNYILDLKDAVCLIQEDGLDYVFVHRSFQEYFTAVFLEKLHGSNVRKILDRLARRFSDNAVTMAIDMAREKVEAEWLLPTLEILIPIFDPSGGRRSTGDTLSNYIGSIDLHSRGLNETHEITSNHESPSISEKNEISDQMIAISFINLFDTNFGVVEIICRSFSGRHNPISIIKALFDVTYKKLNDSIETPGFIGSARYKIIKSVVESSKSNAQKTIRVKFSQEDDLWLDALGIDKILNYTYDTLCQIRAAAIERANSRTTIIDDLLNY